MCHLLHFGFWVLIWEVLFFFSNQELNVGNADKHMQWVLLWSVHLKFSFQTEDVDRELQWMVSMSFDCPNCVILQK